MRNVVPPPPPKAAPPVKGLDLNRLRTYVVQFTSSAKKWHKDDPEEQRAFLVEVLKRGAASQKIDLDNDAADAVLEELHVEVK